MFSYKIHQDILYKPFPDIFLCYFYVVVFFMYEKKKQVCFVSFFRKHAHAWELPTEIDGAVMFSNDYKYREPFV